jgi:hypothetical protein
VIEAEAVIRRTIECIEDFRNRYRYEAMEKTVRDGAGLKGACVLTHVSLVCGDAVGTIGRRKFQQKKSALLLISKFKLYQKVTSNLVIFKKILEDVTVSNHRTMRQCIDVHFQSPSSGQRWNQTAVQIWKYEFHHIYKTRIIQI